MAWKNGNDGPNKLNLSHFQDIVNDTTIIRGVDNFQMDRWITAQSSIFQDISAHGLLNRIVSLFCIRNFIYLLT